MDYSLRKSLLAETDPVRRFGGPGKTDYVAHLGILESTENRHMLQRISDLGSEQESQRVKLDRILAYLEEDE